MRPDGSRSETIKNVPSFNYDRNTDPKNLPYVTPKARDRASDKLIDLGTQRGGNIGLQVSKYRYQEHVVADQEFMHLSGPNVGLTLGGNRVWNSGFFLSGDFRIAYGSHDYKGGDTNLLTGKTIPATHEGEDDWLVDTRLMAGHDFIFRDVFDSYVDFGVSPYLGLGFRYLANDGSGNDSNGVAGYERYSHYLYFPIGVTPRIRITDTTRLSLNAEYDRLIYGWQVSKLSSAIAGATNIRNSQHDGYGLRGSLMYEWPAWSVGPFFNYWNINQSSVACNNIFCGVEPHNQTIEYGLQGKYHF